MVFLEELARIAEIEFSDIDVIDSSRFEKDIKEGFRGFMKYVRSKITRGLSSSM